MGKPAKTILFAAASVALLAFVLSIKFSFSHLTVPAAIGFGEVIKNTPDVLFIGSSHTRKSYDVRQFEKETGRQAYLLAYNGLNYYFMLPVIEYLLDQETLPSTLVIENYVSTASAAPRLQDKNLYYHAPPALKTSLLDALRENGVDFQQLYDLVVASKNQDIVSSVAVNPLLNRVFYKGTHARPLTGHISETQFSELTAPWLHAPPGHPEQIRALEDLLALLKERKVNAVFVESPMPAPIEQDPVFHSTKKSLAAVIRNSGFEYIDGAEGFPVDDFMNFFDAGHLSVRGRKLFTKRIAKRLRSNP